MPTCALNNPKPIGTVLTACNGKPVRLVREISREQYITDLALRREQERNLGRPRARAGMMIQQTKEFIPTQEVGPEFTHFYEIEYI
jgi:hypothetical protein